MKDVKFNKKQKEIFGELGISLVYVFGSQIDGTQNKVSDIDVGIVFDKGVDYQDNKKERYIKLFDIFTDIFRDYKKVDLIFLQETSLMLQSRVALGGEVIYSDDVSRRKEFDYKEYVMKHHADTQYFRDMRQQAILDRI